MGHAGLPVPKIFWNFFKPVLFVLYSPDGVDCFEAQPRNVGLRVVAAQRRQVNTSDGFTKPGCLPLILKNETPKVTAGIEYFRGQSALP